MLNKQKVLSQLQHVVPQLFSTTYQECQQAHILWQWLCDNSVVADSVKDCSSEWPTPLWEEPLSTAESLLSQKLSYTVTAVDGSQIYPDRHQGIGCYLLNIGTITLAYNDHMSTIECDSVPYVFAPQESDSEQLSAEIINCHRGELELQRGLEISRVIKAQDARNHLFLCDGSLILWHLDSKELKTKEPFLEKSLQLLDQFYEQRLLIAGFISLPKSKELVNILRTAIKQRLVPVESHSVSFEYIVDTDILVPFLPTLSRSALFAHCSNLANRYPAHLRPYFLYVNCGQEIVRVEVPAWIAHDKECLNTVLTIILDQCIKGYGYPVALSEAHEQAVVKNVDREFFFQMLYTLSKQHNYSFKPSQKSVKKKFVSI
jgi:hypothetical protein